MKQKIIEILIKNQETVYGKGSCGELGESYQGIISDDFEFIAEQIEKLTNKLNKNEFRTN